MAWDQIVKAILAIVLIVLIIFYFVKSVHGGIETIPSITFEIKELIRCRFKTTPCLSLFPNPVKSGENVTATIRGRIWHNNKKAYVVRLRDGHQMAECTIERERCSVSFKVTQEDSGYYTAYIDGERDNEKYYLQVNP